MTRGSLEFIAMQIHFFPNVQIQRVEDSKIYIYDVIPQKVSHHIIWTVKYQIKNQN